MQYPLRGLNLGKMCFWQCILTVIRSVYFIRASKTFNFKEHIYLDGQMFSKCRESFKVLLRFQADKIKDKIVLLVKVQAKCGGNALESHQLVSSFLALKLSYYRWLLQCQGSESKGGASL